MKNLALIIFALIALGAQSCSLPEVKDLQYEREHKDIVDELQKLHGFEKALIETSVTVNSGVKTDELSIELVNGNNLVAEEPALKELSKEALRILVNSIGNEADYDKFNVTFKNEQQAGPISRSFKKSFEFELEDIQ